MTTDGRHPVDDVQALLDGRLPEARRAEVEAHVAACRSCRAELDALGAVRQSLREAGSEFPGPGIDLEALLDAEDAAREPATLGRRRFLAAAAAVGLAALGLWAWRGRRHATADLAETLAADFRATAGGHLELERTTTDTAALERWFAEDRIPFGTHVYDLAMMDLVLAGGRVHRIAGRPSALFAYRNAAGRWLVCQMYPGTPAELPAGAVQHDARGFRFYRYDRDGVTVVFWAEGAILCALASDLPSDLVMELAIAKAMG